MIIIISIIAGVFLIPMLLASTGNLSNNIIDADDLTFCSVPLIGKIPQIGKMPTISRLYNFFKVEYKFEKTPQLLQFGNGKANMASQAILKLSTTFLQLTQNAKSTPVAVMTSFIPNSGKTFLLTNLATSLALGKKKIVIIDLDIRRASLSELIKSPYKGIVAYLSETTDDINDIIVKGYITPYLDIIPAGRFTPPNPVEILESTRLNTLINDLKSEYDYILIDCPPIEIIADTYLVSKLADYTLFTIRSGFVDRRLIPVLNDLYSRQEYPGMKLILNGIDNKL